MTDRVRDERPWGTYTVLDSSEAFKVKRIEVFPGRRLSYQRHSHRAEHWFVVAGEGIVTVDGNRVSVSVRSAVDIPVGAAHRIENTGPAMLVFIEVQHGDSFARKAMSFDWRTTSVVSSLPAARRERIRNG